jgi:hypothetical protein
MANPPVSYKYDVFFSYKRRALTLDWTRQVHRQLELWLSEELNRSAEIFVDTEQIESGMRWPHVLQDALRTSRCMGCVWSPSYFQSGWCVSEWKSFRKREDQVGCGSHGLIAPLRFHDGEHFPEEAQLIQQTDVSAYKSTLPAFWNSPRALELEDTLKLFARTVSKIIHRAPPFRPDWPIADHDGLPAPRIELSRL